MLLALVAAPAATAGELSWDGATRTLVYEQDPDLFPLTNDVTVSPQGTDVRFTDASATITVLAGTPCTPVPPHAAVCSDVAALAVLLGPMEDRFTNATSLRAFVCGRAGSDTITGGAGRDTLGGGAGRDEVSGGDGVDLIAIDLGSNCPASAGTWAGEVLSGGPGDDQLHGGAGADVLDGGDGDDQLRGYAGEDRLSGGAGRDDLVGFEGADRLLGGDDRDRLFGGTGDDRLEGGADADVLGGPARLDVDGIGGTRETVLLVETGDDVLDGGDGDDTLIAGPGENLHDPSDPLGAERRGVLDRTLLSADGNGADVLRGGPGLDAVSYANRVQPVRVTPDGVADDGVYGEGDRVEADVEVITGGAGDDVLFAGPAGSTLAGDLGTDTLTGADGPDRLRGGLADAARDVLTGGGGDDDLGGGGGDDVLDGGPGADMLAGDDGDDRLRGDAGDDTLAGGTGSDRLEGGTGADCLGGFVPCGAAATAAGADGDDVLAGGPGADRLEGGGGEDVADYADATGPVLVALTGTDPGAAATERTWADRDVLAADVEGARGGPGADTLLGNAGDNLLVGGAGDDLIDGGAGADRLQGGPGRDLLVARDAALDELRCGPGMDLAALDDGDAVVAMRADLCELADTGAQGALTRVLGTPACPIRFQPPGTTRSFRIGAAIAVPWRTLVLTERCGVTLQPPRDTRRARLRGAAFSIERGRRGARLTLAPRGPVSCARPRRLDVTAAGLLLVDARRADVLGSNADWTVSERCNGTRVTVRRGRARLAGGRTLRAPAAVTVRGRG